MKSGLHRDQELKNLEKVCFDSIENAKDEVTYSEGDLRSTRTSEIDRSAGESEHSHRKSCAAASD